MPDLEVERLFSGLEVHLDPAPADWVVLSLEAWGTGPGFPVASLLPPHFDRYARVFHPASAQGTYPGIPPLRRWSDIALASGRVMHPAVQFTKLVPHDRAPHGYRQQLPRPWQGTLEPGARAALTALLAEHTATPESCWFCMWNGFGTLPHEVALRYGVVRAQARRYILLSGPLAEVHKFTGRHLWGPQIWWPTDRAWCVATEIDLDSTVVAGSGRLIDSILRSPDLEALPVDRQTRLDYLGDVINSGTISDEELERLRQQL